MINQNELKELEASLAEKLGKEGLGEDLTLEMMLALSGQGSRLAEDLIKKLSKDKQGAPKILALRQLINGINAFRRLCGVQSTVNTNPGKTHKPQRDKAGNLIPFEINRKALEAYDKQRKKEEANKPTEEDKEKLSRISKREATEDDLAGMSEKERTEYNTRLRFDRIAHLEATEEDLVFLHEFDKVAFNAYLKRAEDAEVEVEIPESLEAPADPQHEEKVEAPAVKKPTAKKPSPPKNKGRKS